MDIDLQIVFRDENKKPLCFKCAVKRVMDNGEDIKPEVDDFRNEYCVNGTPKCIDCGEYIV